MSTDHAPEAPRKPAALNEFSLRAVLCGLVVAVLMGASYPYVVLKLGFGPSVSVVAAIFGYLILGLIVAGLTRAVGKASTPFNRWENNIVQTAGTAAAQTAFMCVLLAAFDMLRQSKTIEFAFVLTPVQSFLWLTTAGLFGVFMAVPLRRHFIVDEKLPYPDGIAAAETVVLLDAGGSAARRASAAMVGGIIASAALMSMHKGNHAFEVFDPTYVFGTGVIAVTGFGIEWSLLALGSGMLLSLRINLSMLAGAVLSWVIAPYLLQHYGVIGEKFKKSEVLFWVMWPATGMLVAGGLTALVLRWRILVRAFRHLTAGAGLDEFPLKWVIAGSAASAIALIVVQRELFGQPVWITVLAILFSIPLAIVGLRVLGETNWGPVSALSNMMQGIFASFAPGNVAANMMASGTTGTAAINSQAVMQDYKTGEIIGSSPRKLTYMQLLATPVGAAAVAWVYPILRDQYGIGEEGLSSPISRKWAGFAEILSKGLDALPPGALTALIIGSLVGVLLAVLESRDRIKWLVPSATGLGIGMLVPASVVVTMCLGGVIAWVWSKRAPKSAAAYLVPLASGLIAGEALVAVIVPLLVVLGVVKA